MPPLGFSQFYGQEFHRVSSNLAEHTGSAALGIDWLGGGIILTTVTLAGAIHLTQSSYPHDARIELMAPLRASDMVLLAAVATMISVVLVVIETIRMAFGSQFYGVVSAAGTFRYLFTHPDVMLQLGIGLLALQVAWRWRRHGALELAILPLEPGRVFWTWMGLSATVIVGYPVFAACGFCFWLGPWHRESPSW